LYKTVHHLFIIQYSVFVRKLGVQNIIFAHKTSSLLTLNIEHRKDIFLVFLF